MREIQIKEQKLRDYMALNGYEGILLFRRDTFSWLTGGRINHIIHSTEFGMMALLITADQKYCVANQVEMHRMMKEEDLEGLGYLPLPVNWWEEDYLESVRRQFGGIKLASDKPLPGVSDIYEDLKRLRYSLMPEELQRYRELCAVCTHIVEDTCRTLKPGKTEYEVCGCMIGKAAKEGIEASVALVASDYRIFEFRHPIDTMKRIDKYAMVVLCGRKYGLFANLTRFVHFGALPQELCEKFEKVRKIEVEMMSHTVPGKSVADVFRTAVREYEKAGYPDEWTRLHQGGPTGYATRDFLATPNNEETICHNQAYTWNPSITGTKSEDTILVGEQGFEVLTDSGYWPTVDVKTNSGLIVKRPDVLIR